MEESKIANNSVDLISKKNIEESDWRSFRNNQDGIRSRAHIKKSFFDEHKHNVKNWHFNKRKTYRPMDNSDSFSKDLCPQPMIFPMEKNTDQVYQTAIPNTVSPYFGLVINFLRLHTAMKDLEAGSTILDSPLTEISSLLPHR